ncbi:MAG: hypothetical protein LBN95_13745 [Prevotellaceae bacterium]|jgi:hypothetical protein|nr:hypothetical protein [Prevotellaceae bacterium]
MSTFNLFLEYCLKRKLNFNVKFFDKNSNPHIEYNDDFQKLIKFENLDLANIEYGVGFLEIIF